MLSGGKEHMMMLMKGKVFLWGRNTYG